MRRGTGRRGDEVRVPRKDRRGMSPVTAGAIALTIAVIGTYFGFAKHLPFTHGFRLEAVFTSAQSIRTNSPVRIAGVNVGKVRGQVPQGDRTPPCVTMEIQKRGLPIHKDATLKIRPRIFLEGNYFVDLPPGHARLAHAGRRRPLPVTQTSTPVQLDQVLDALELQHARRPQGPARRPRDRAVHQPTAAEDAGAGSLGPGADGGLVAERLPELRAGRAEGHGDGQRGLLGSQRDDLSRLVASSARSRAPWTATRCSSRT